MPLVTLLTDFGTADGYVAELKAVLAAEAPGVTVVDATHDVAPHDVDAGRLALARYWRRFPPGTVHVCVVDPGVGSSRAALAVESHGRLLLGPDNGLLSPALLFQGARVVALPVPAGVAPTFHGRDVFAPAAARLATGAALDDLGADQRRPGPVQAPGAAHGLAVVLAHGAVAVRPVAVELVVPDDPCAVASAYDCVFAWAWHGPLAFYCGVASYDPGYGECGGSGWLWLDS